MHLHIIDLAIIGVYLLLTLLIGIFISKRASKNIDSYFLSGRKIPWYILGVSNASSMFDITHIIWLVSFFVVYGMKSMWIPWLWPVFNQIFLMVYLSAWIRKSNVLTGAEWIKTRFGNDRGSELSSLSVVIFALVSVIGFISYAFKGIGKFSVEFLPWNLSPDIYAVIFMGITTFYVIAGGMYSVVLTDVLQFLVLTVGSFIVGFIAIKNVSPEMIYAVVPKGWESIFSGWHLSLDWTGLINSANTKIAGDGYSLFYIFIMMMLFKGLLVSMAGAAPNYDMQRILATKNPKEASLMSGIVTLLLGFPRYFMVAGISILALVFFSPQFNAMGANMDFERVLPFVINNYIPTGLTGLLIAGLIAAFMSTFDSTVNAGAAYLVNDIYKKYINKNGSDKKYVFAGYIASLLVVIAGVFLGFHLESIDEITQWLFAALFTGYAIPNILKWHWWRFNGYGYFWGMIGGIIGAIIIPNIFSSLTALQAFPFISIASLVGSIAGALLTEQQPMNELISFYKQVKPWGFWRPVYEEISKESPEFKRNMQSKRDLFNVAVGIVWQFSFMALPAYIILRMGNEILILLIIVALTSYILKKNWFDKLEKE
jgi:solute:Na+ symporter, SSS family